MIRNTVGIVMMTILICGTSLAITIDGNFDDWAGVTTKVNDDQDMADSMPVWTDLPEIGYIYHFAALLC